jgi:hypothetical protein
MDAYWHWLVNTLYLHLHLPLGRTRGHLIMPHVTGVLIVTGFIPIFLSEWPWQALRISWWCRRVTRPFTRKRNRWCGCLGPKKDSRRVAPAQQVPAQQPPTQHAPQAQVATPAGATAGGVRGGTPSGNGAASMNGATGAREAVYMSPITPPAQVRTATSLNHNAVNGTANGNGNNDVVALTSIGTGTAGNSAGNDNAVVTIALPTNGLTATAASSAAADMSPKVAHIALHGGSKVTPFIVNAHAPSDVAEPQTPGVDVVTTVATPNANAAAVVTTNVTVPQSSPKSAQQQRQHSQLAVPVTVVQSTPIAITASGIPSAAATAPLGPPATHPQIVRARDRLMLARSISMWVTITAMIFTFIGSFLDLAPDACYVLQAVAPVSITHLSIVHIHNQWHI